MCKTKTNKTNACFRSSLTPTRQETDRAYFAAPETHGEKHRKAKLAHTDDMDEQLDQAVSTRQLLADVSRN